MYNTLFSLNWIELILGAFLGLGISIIWDKYKCCQRSKTEKKKYSFLLGKYQSVHASGETKADAEIVYIKDNLLKITVKHGVSIWSGTISMSTTEFGNLAFAYHDSPENVGIKLIVLSSDRKSFTLIPEIYYMTSKEKEFDKEIYHKVY